MGIAQSVCWLADNAKNMCWEWLPMVTGKPRAAKGRTSNTPRSSSNPERRGSNSAWRSWPGACPQTWQAQEGFVSGFSESAGVLPGVAPAQFSQHMQKLCRWRAMQGQCFTSDRMRQAQPGGGQQQAVDGKALGKHAVMPAAAVGGVADDRVAAGRIHHHRQATRSLARLRPAAPNRPLDPPIADPHRPCSPHHGRSSRQGRRFHHGPPLTATPTSTKEDHRK